MEKLLVNRNLVFPSLAVFIILGSLSCAHRNLGDKSNLESDRVGTVTMTQAKGFGGFDGYRELAIFNEFFSTSSKVESGSEQTEAVEHYRCSYASHIRVRKEENLYDEKQRDKRYSIHMKEARPFVSKERLQKRAMRAIGIKDTNKLTLAQAEVLSDVHPISESFLNLYLSKALGDAQTQACVAQKMQESSASSQKTRVPELATIATACGGWGALGIGFASLIVVGGGIPLTGVAIISGAAGALSTGGGLIVGGMATVKTAQNAVNYVNGSLEEKESERLVHSIRELRTMNQKSFERSIEGTDYELYRPRFTFDDLDLSYADENLTLEELKKDPNVQAMNRLSVDHMHKLMEDAFVEAHVEALKEAAASGGKNAVRSVLLVHDCAPDTKALFIENDLKFYDGIKTIPRD
jgi:hypothetical protein